MTVKYRDVNAIIVQKFPGSKITSVQQRLWIYISESCNFYIYYSLDIVNGYFPKDTAQDVANAIISQIEEYINTRSITYVNTMD